MSNKYEHKNIFSYNHGCHIICKDCGKELNYEETYDVRIRNSQRDRIERWLNDEM